MDLHTKPDREADCIVARVRSVLGPVATLARVGRLTPELLARLRPGAMGFLTFEHGGTTVALRGITLMHGHGGQLEFVVVDGIQLTERRTAARVPFVTPVRASPMNEDGTVVGITTSTVTENLSMGGALIARETPTHIGVRFVNMQDADRARLATSIIAHQRGAA